MTTRSRFNVLCLVRPSDRCGRRQRNHRAEDTPGTIDVLGNDSDVDAPLAVRAVDGTAITVGGAVVVANGSVTLNADGTLTFTPAGISTAQTSFSYSDRSCLHYQFFDREDTSTSHGREYPDRGRRRGLRDDFDVAALAQQLSGNTDYFGIRYTGSIHVAAGGSYTFYTTSDDGSALYVDGVMVVNNDFSQGATERSGVVTLTAGTHAIEIRYFEGGGGEELQVHVSGPDTAGVKTALLESALVGTATAMSRHRPGGERRTTTRQSRRHGRCRGADRRAARSRRDGVGPRARCAQWRCRPLHRRDLTLQRDGGAVTEDVFGFDTSGALFTVSGNDLKFGGATFATIVNETAR